MLETNTSLKPDAITIKLSDARPGTLDLFKELSEAQREQLSKDAWTIGLRAISNAYSTAQESRLSDIGKDLMQGLEKTLSGQLNDQQKQVDDVLSAFFEPNDGKVYERLKHFIDDK